MNEPKTSIHLPEKPVLRISPLILAGILLLSAVLLYGVYLYVTGQLVAEINLEESLGTTETDRSTLKSEARSPLSPAPESSEALPIESDLGVQDDTDSVESAAGLPEVDESDAFVRDTLAGLSRRQEFANWIGMEHLIPKMTPNWAVRACAGEALF